MKGRETECVYVWFSSACCAHNANQKIQVRSTILRRATKLTQRLAAHLLRAANIRSSKTYIAVFKVTLPVGAWAEEAWADEPWASNDMMKDIRGVKGAERRINLYHQVRCPSLNLKSLQPSILTTRRKPCTHILLHKIKYPVFSNLTCLLGTTQWSTNHKNPSGNG